VKADIGAIFIVIVLIGIVWCIAGSMLYPENWSEFWGGETKKSTLNTRWIEKPYAKLDYTNGVSRAVHIGFREDGVVVWGMQ